MGRQNEGGSGTRSPFGNLGAAANQFAKNAISSAAPAAKAPPKAPPAPPQPPSAPIAPRSGGSAAVPPSGNRYGNTPTGTIAPVAAPAPPAPPDINSFLAGDTTYQEQVNQLKKAFADYQANQQLQTGQYNTQYQTNLADLNKQKGVDLQAVQDDYGARGLLTSGLFTKAYGDLSNDYANRQKALDTGKSDFLAQLQQAAQTYKNSQDTTSAKAKQDAINRRAAQYGI